MAIHLSEESLYQHVQPSPCLPPHGMIASTGPNVMRAIADGRQTGTFLFGAPEQLVRWALALHVCMVPLRWEDTTVEHRWNVCSWARVWPSSQKPSGNSILVTDGLFFYFFFLWPLNFLRSQFPWIRDYCSAITAYNPTQPTGFLGQEETHTFLQSSQHMQLLCTVPQQGQSKCELVGWLVHSCSFPSLIWVTP